MVTSRGRAAAVVVGLLLAVLAVLASEHPTRPAQPIVPTGAVPAGAVPGAGGGGDGAAAYTPAGTPPDRPPRPAVPTRGGAVPAASPAATFACPWLDATQPVSRRVDQLIAAMSPLQEATMLHVLQATTTMPYEGFTPAIPELCIPVISEQDGPAGVGAGFRGATQLPAPIADAAAFDPVLAGRYGSLIGAEDAAKGVDMALAPTINIDRSPKWGRSYETLGEDPFLTASLAVPLIRGIQANRVVAVVKHLAVYNQETRRGSPGDDAVVSERAMREIYLPAFSSAAQQGDAGAIMCSYNLINGTPACQDAALMGIVHREWGFAGFVRSDCGSIYAQAPAMAAGVSQVKCTSFYDPVSLAADVADGRLPRATLDALARPLLTVLLRFDLLAAPHPLHRTTVVETPAHAEVARLADDEGAVLLRNQGHALPVDLARVRCLALIGPGGGTPMPIGVGGARVVATQPVDALAALQAEMGSRVLYDPGADPAQAARVAARCPVAVVAVYDVEAEGADKASLALPGAQDQLVEAVAAANPRTVVVLETGSAVLMPWADRVPAILETWYPGALAGPSLVDLLTGRVDPGGRLPVTFPVSEALMPDNTPATFPGVAGHTLYRDDLDVGYRWYDVNRVTPAYPFGYGLSYTTFALGDLRATADGSGRVTASVTVTNTGSVAGADVVQLYVGGPPSTGEPPRQLRAFQRVDLQPHSSVAVSLAMTPGDLATWDAAAHTWRVAGGSYHLMVGDGSGAGGAALSGAVTLPALDLGADSGPTR